MFLTKKSSNLLRRNANKARVNVTPEREKNKKNEIRETNERIPSKKQKNNIEKNEDKKYDND